MIAGPSRTAVAATLAAAAVVGNAAQGGGRSPARPEAVWFEEVASRAGLEFVYRSGHAGTHYMPETIAGGAALFDMDADGDLDAYLVQGGSLVTPARRSGNQLFRNRGDGTFDDVTAGSGALVRKYGLGVAAGDYDNDGDVDLYVTNAGPNALLRNDRAGHFTDVTKLARVGDPGLSTSAAFLDYDRDGDLDLYVANYINWSVATEIRCYTFSGAPDYCGPKSYRSPALDTLYRNNGNGTFTDVTTEAGLRATLGNGLGVVVGDFNADGWPDIFVANDGSMNQLWMNQGRGLFKDEALLMGCALDQDGITKAGMGTHAVDVDDDGDLDLLVVNLRGESDSFFRNEGRFFLDDTIAVGLRTVSRPFTRFGMGMLDFDNDGRLDLFEANGRVFRQPAERFASDSFAEPSLLFRGTADGRFEEVQPRGGTAKPQVATSRAAAFGDLDNDGGIDVVVVNRDAPAFVLHNIVRHRGHWIGFRVVEEHGRDALGAQLALSLAGRRITRDVRAAYSYLASNDPRVHVGLGGETMVGDVQVRWVDGTLESFGTQRADQYITLRKGKGRRLTR